MGAKVIAKVCDADHYTPGLLFLLCTFINFFFFGFDYFWHKKHIYHCNIGFLSQKYQWYLCFANIFHVEMCSLFYIIFFGSWDRLKPFVPYLINYNIITCFKTIQSIFFIKHFLFSQQIFYASVLHCSKYRPTPYRESLSWI